MRIHGSRFFWAMLLAAVLVAMPSLAARITPGDESTQDPECIPAEGDDHCQDNTQQGPNGDPEDCDVDENSNGASYAHCIQTTTQGDGYNSSINMGSGGQTQVNVWGDPLPDGSGYEEIDSFCLREASDFIQSVGIAIDKPRLVAKISLFTEVPTDFGTITISVGHDPAEGGAMDVVTIDTLAAGGDVQVLNDLVCSSLKSAGLTLDCLNSFFVVHTDSLGKSPRSLLVVVDDPDLETLEVALEPASGHPDATNCTPDPEMGGPI